MTILTSVLTVGILGMVFGLAAITMGIIVVSMLYAPVREARDFLFGWRQLTCPQTNAAVQVRVQRLPRGSLRRFVVVSCGRFGDAAPTCHQGCMSTLCTA